MNYHVNLKCLANPDQGRSFGAPMTTARSRFVCPVLALCCLAAPAHSQPFWPQFRGPSGNGVSDSGRPPLVLSVTNTLWKVEVPPGHSSPCIWGGQIFLTTCQEKKLECRAYDRASGTLLWARTVPAEKIEATHAFNNPAAPTPAADAERVIFYFGSYGLLAYTHDGTPVWEKKLPPPVSRGNYGSGCSPALCGDLVIQALDTDDGGSRLLAFKRATGERAWETARPLFTSGWSTPVVWAGAGKPQIILLGSKKLAAYDPADGSELWSVPGFPLETAPSPAFDDHQVYACAAGVGGRSNPKFEGTGWTDLQQFDANKEGKVLISAVPENYHLVIRPELPEGHPGRTLPFPIKGVLQSLDKNKDGAVTKEEWDQGMAAFEEMDKPVLMALRPAAKEGDGPNRVAWQISRGIPEVPSPLCCLGKLFLVRDGGLIQCLTTSSGSVLYQERLGAPGGYTASPVSADGRIYLASQLGTITVIDARADQLKVLSQNALGETITATPAPAEDKLYVRTEKHLYAFGGRVGQAVTR
jgi:outer membrane protein assembly factor BamB